LLFGLENYPGLPQASTLCGACLEVCPVKIDLPRMLVALRADSVEQGLIHRPEVFTERLTANLMTKPRRMNFLFKLGRLGQLLMQLFGLKFKGFENFPVIADKSFHELWNTLETSDDQ
ncbi:MAG: hypothetical protein P8Y68_09075, partial [Anaerolineales bacterium]